MRWQRKSATPKQSRDEVFKPTAKAGRGRGSVAETAAHAEARAQQANRVSPSTSLEFASTKGGTALERGVLARAFPTKCCPLTVTGNPAREIPGRDQ